MTENKVANVDDVITTSELARRSTREPDFETENTTLSKLALELSAHPKAILQKIVDCVMSGCRGESAGISIRETVAGKPQLRWEATAGGYEKFAGVTIPFEQCPCAEAIEQNQVVMMEDIGRAYPAIAQYEPSIAEILVAPVEVDGQPVGTVWAVSHSRRQHFDREDARILTNLSRFAAVACRLIESHAATEKASSLAKEREVFLHRIFESSADCIKILDLEGNLLFMTESGQRQIGITDFSKFENTSWVLLWDQKDQLSAQEALILGRAGGVGSFQAEATSLDGRRRYWDNQITSLPGEFGEVDRLLCISRDITILKDAEKQRSELASELAHRMKNSLAMVQAIITQSFRQAATIKDASEAISGRIGALSRAQDVLTQRSWATADIRQIVDVALGPYDDFHGRFIIDGPPIELTAQQGLGLSLAIHELSTNAMKYGALSLHEGSVEIKWDIGRDAKFCLSWTERDGPRVKAPARTGFGTRLVERIVAPYFKGSATLDFDEAGVIFRLKGEV